MIRNSSVITENALQSAGNVTTMMIAVTTATSKIAVFISSGSLENIYIDVLRLSETMRYRIIVSRWISIYSILFTGI